MEHEGVGQCVIAKPVWSNVEQLRFACRENRDMKEEEWNAFRILSMNATTSLYARMLLKFTFLQSGACATMGII